MHPPAKGYSLPPPPPWVTTLGLSILLHLLLLGLITHNFERKTQHSKAQHSPPASAPIVATLVYAVSTKIEVANEVVSKTLPSELVDDTAAQAAQSLAEKDAEIPVEDPETLEQAEVFKQAEVLAAQVSAPPQQQVQVPVDANAPQPASPQTPQLASPLASPPASLNYSVLGSGKAYMDALEEAKDQQVAAQASEAYQKAKNSPLISAPQIDPFISEDEKFARAIQILTDCSNRVNQTLRVITGLTGGLVQCSELPQIEGFIQQRLKQHTRPAASATK